MKKIVLALGLFLLSQASFAADQSTENSGLYVAVPQIMGGYEAPVGAWPWMTALLHSDIIKNFDAQYCGGVLIAANWVLTAGHCVEGRSAGQINVAVGVHDLYTWSGTRIAVKRIVLHPSYVDYFHPNDIALLELNSSSGQTPIIIYSGASVQELDSRLLGKMTTLIGWGHADDKTTNPTSWYYPSKLQQVNLPVVTDSYCNNAYGVTLTGSQVCAGYSVAKDACRGDSGGPMMSQVDGQWAHVGLVSYGRDCQASNGYYGVYTRTSAYVDFIKQYVPTANFTAGATTPPTTTSQTLPWLMLLLH